MILKQILNFLPTCLHACSLYEMDSTTKRRSSRLLTPLIYNALWISWSFIVIFTTFFWAIYAAHLHSVLESNYLSLFSLLEQASNSWTESHDFSKIPLQAILRSVNLTKKSANQLSWIIHRWAYTWLAWAIVLAIVSEKSGSQYLQVFHRSTTFSSKNLANME